MRSMLRWETAVRLYLAFGKEYGACAKGMGLGALQEYPGEKWYFEGIRPKT